MELRVADVVRSGEDQWSGSVLGVEKIKKRFGHITALDGVTVEFSKGLTAVVGDNGAGKSTLLKILSGALEPDEGRVWLRGKEVLFDSIRDARRLGIEPLYQDLALVDTMSIAENLFLGREITRTLGPLKIIDRRAMEAEADRALAEVKVGMPGSREGVRSLSGGQRQAVAVVRALRFGASVVLLDEPTAALGPKETAAFLEVIRFAVEQGRTVVMVGHNLPQVLEISDEIVVMRAGKVVMQCRPKETSLRELTEFMVG